MPDPHEGVSQAGIIQTGAARGRIVPSFAPVLDAAIAAMPGGVSLYVYGSVANGTATPGVSDVDLLTIGLDASRAAKLGEEMSARFAGFARGVEVAAAHPNDFLGDSDSAYGGRVFLRHYCVHLAGPNPAIGLPAFPADRRAARGFNGDIGEHHRRWRDDLDDGADPNLLARRMARKTLLAVAGLVSIHDNTWTTDRKAAASRWGEMHPALAADMQVLTCMAAGRGTFDRTAVLTALDGVAAQVVDAFRASVGLWDGAAND